MFLPIILVAGYWVVMGVVVIGVGGGLVFLLFGTDAGPAAIAGIVVLVALVWFKMAKGPAKQHFSYFRWGWVSLLK
ncbi:MAG: hypothetical protein EXQ84_07815 [Rhodospirillaceae bacterium]|nr:hypothetical protein [Rhodospirillaceae bacterium]